MSKIVIHYSTIGTYRQIDFSLKYTNNNSNNNNNNNHKIYTQRSYTAYEERVLGIGLALISPHVLITT